MSILIDELLKQDHPEEEITKGSWYKAKPLNKIKLRDRIKDALNVLYGNARAYHYFEDEANTWGEVK